MDDLLPKLRKIIESKSMQEEYVDKLLICRVIQTLEEYIADNLTPSTRHEKVKCNARIEAYEDCIKLLRELV